jgi:ABC-type transporter Mla MlaB component
MPTTHAPHLEAFRTEAGCLIRVAGRGTMRESRVCHDYALRCLEGAAADGWDPPEPLVVIDLSECQRLDSTFLGALVDLHNRFNGDGKTRVAIAAPPGAARELLSCSRLDRLLPVWDEPPPARGEGAPLVADRPLDAGDLGRHVMECHRRLAEQGGPAAKIFARIADQLQRELDERDQQRGIMEA